MEALRIKRSGFNGTSLNPNPLDASNFPVQQEDDSATDNESAIIGSASDYILIAMIVAMMFCMAICCLYLFCRSTSRFSVCGFNFEMNDRNSFAVDDLSELHEVVPLTPTTAGSYQLPDIENILQGDPPPPRYSDVAPPLPPLHRFKWKSKRKFNSTSEDKSVLEANTKQIGKRKEKQTPIQRSTSYQQTSRLSRLHSNTRSKTPTERTKKHSFFSLKPRRQPPALGENKNATFPQISVETPMSYGDESSDKFRSEDEKGSKIFTISNSATPSTDNNSSADTNRVSELASQEDDEVFM